MLPLGGYQDSLGWVLTMATFRRASWRGEKCITTSYIVEYFLQFKKIQRSVGWEVLRRMAQNFHFCGVYAMIEWLAGGRPDED